MTRQLKYREAITEALAQEMERDPRVVVFGEDVAGAGGTFLATRGLLERFGPVRVRDTPISESALVGMAVGAAMTGLRPVVEIMFFDFLTLTADQLVNHAAKVASVSAGELGVPMVVRTISGAGRSGGPQHAQNFESWVAHVPGLKLVMPSSPADVKGLLTAAIRDPDPVVVVESLAVWSSTGEVPEGEHLVHLGVAAVAREGDDVTIVSWGAAVPRCLRAAEALEERNVSAEVIDLRTISPLDEEAILHSLSKTGRLVVVHDAVAPFGAGAEIAALAASTGFAALRAPVVRVTPPFAPPPLPSSLQAAYYPQPDDVVKATLALLDRADG